MTSTLEHIELDVTVSEDLKCEANPPCENLAVWAGIHTCCGATFDLCQAHKDFHVKALERYVRVGMSARCSLCQVLHNPATDLARWARLPGGDA